MHTNSGTVLIVFFLLITPEHISNEDSIITLQLFDFWGRFLPKPFFETNILHHGLSLSKGKLIQNPYYASWIVLENSPTMKIKVIDIMIISTLWKTRDAFHKFCDKFYARADIFGGGFFATPQNMKNQDI